MAQKKNIGRCLVLILSICTCSSVEILGQEESSVEMFGPDGFRKCTTIYSNGKPIVVCKKTDLSKERSMERRSGREGEGGHGGGHFRGGGNVGWNGSKGGRGGQTASSRLVPVWDLLLPKDEPPKDVTAYGIVTFTERPPANEIERYRSFCEALKATLLSKKEAETTLMKDQMITFWPVTEKGEQSAADNTCDFMIEKYDLKSGLDAISDADQHKQYLAQKRGPFLIAWSPSSSRTNPSAVILTIDMSDLDSSDSFRETLKAWRQKIIDDPSFRENGFSMQRTRLAFRDLIDKYGETLLPFLPQHGK